MSRDYAEMEREFIDNLKADTGRDVGEWMLAINAQNLAHRNDIIDWLRQQGFLFAWASWLERIHHNGGKPVYPDAPEGLSASDSDAEAASPATSSAPLDSAPRTGVETQKQRPPVPPRERQPALRLVHSAPPKATPPTPTVPRQEAAPTPPPAVRADDISGPISARKPSGSMSAEVRALIAAAKAYAPLASFVVKKITEAVPATEISAEKKLIVFAAPLPFAVLAIGGKDLKLVFAGSPGDFQAPVERAKLPNAVGNVPAGLTHMFTLSDARQVDAAFKQAIQEAWSRANSI